jgi:hypothetical protein
MNRKHPIPAPGCSLISGKRAPPKQLGSEFYCQLRNGICAKEPWPTSTTRWIHDGSDGDVVAVRRPD